MPLQIWLASTAIIASVPLAWWALTSERRLAQRVGRNLGTHAPTLRSAVLDESPLERFFSPLVRGLGGSLLRFTPAGWVEARSTAVAKAGLTGRVSAEQILGAKAILPVLVGGVLALRLSGEWTVQSAVVAVTLVVVAFFVPDLLVRARADRRAEEITLLLPDVLDQLTISVEAGLGFEAALARIVESETHPLAREFGRTLQDIQLGTGRLAALEALANRSQVDDLRTVVLALRQAESLGVPLARTLRTLAGEMREKRRFRAEEKAHQLPIKMIFPLGLCIFPALFIVILGPGIVTYLQLFR